MHARDLQTVQKGGYCVAIIMIFLFLNTLGFAQDEEKIVIGHEVRMRSTILEKEMRPSIHVPDDYNRSDERYPVLYMFQTHFKIGISFLFVWQIPHNFLLSPPTDILG